MTQVTISQVSKDELEKYVGSQMTNKMEADVPTTDIKMEEDI